MTADARQSLEKARDKAATSAELCREAATQMAKARTDLQRLLASALPQPTPKG